MSFSHSVNQLLHIKGHPYIVLGYLDFGEPLIRLFAHRIDSDRDAVDGVPVKIDNGRATWMKVSGMPTGVPFSGRESATLSLEIPLPPPIATDAGAKIRLPITYHQQCWWVERKKKGMITEEIVSRVTPQYVAQVVAIAWPIVTAEEL